MLCINSGMLAENMEKSLFTQPWLMGKGLHKLSLSPDHRYVRSPVGVGSQWGFSLTWNQTCLDSVTQGTNLAA